VIGGVERFVAWRYLRPTRGEGFISVIAGFALVGIALGVGTLIVVLAVMQGFREELLGRVLGVNGHAIVASGPEGIAGYDDLDGPPAPSPRRHGCDALRRGPSDGQRQRRVRRRPGPRRARRGHGPARHLRRQRRAGRHRQPGEPDTAIVGARMAERMGLGLGSNITLISPKGVATAFGTVPRVKTFKVGGIFESGCTSTIRASSTSRSPTPRPTSSCPAR
jgi:lipoprotein-releasing system permease protein